MDERDNFQWLGNSKDVYDIYFNNMVSGLAEDFTQGETEKLCFIFQKQFSMPFKEKHGHNALKLLEALMQKKELFSSDKPLKLAKLMGLLEFHQKKEKVETFIEQYKDLIPIQHRDLPPIPSAEPIQEQAEDPYVTLHKTNISTRPTSTVFTSTRPVQCDSSSVHSEDARSDEAADGSFVQLSPMHHSRNLKSSTMRSGYSNPSSTSTDDEDGIYTEPYFDILRPMQSQESFPLLQERMKLLIKPLRDTVQSRRYKLLTCPPFHCHLPKCTFLLEINPLDDGWLSAKLYLEEGSQMESGELSQNYYLVQLQVSESKKKCQEFSQHLYSHSTIMKKPISSDRSTTPTYHSHSEAQVTQSRAGRISPECIGKVCVASFPGILSHEMLMDQKLITRGHLMFSFTLRHYRPPSSII